MLNIQPATLRNTLEQLEHAVQDHLDWHAQLLRAIVCELPGDPNDLAARAHHLCRFGRWYYERTPAELREQPTFVAIGIEHRQVHDLAARILCDSAAGRPVQRALFDELVATSVRLRGELELFKRELRAALRSRDALTGALDRDQALPELRRWRATSASGAAPWCIVLMDVDGLETVNGQYGYAIGDALLAECARLAQELLRPGDKVFRYGGDEFLITLPGADLAAAKGITASLRDGLAGRELFVSGAGSTLHVTASFGIAQLETGIRLEDCIDHAAQALLLAKAAGGNRAISWDPAAITGRHWRRLELDEVPRSIGDPAQYEPGPRLKNWQLFAICVLTWGTTWYAITFQIGHTAPEVGVAFRFALAGVTVLATCAIRGIRLRFGLREHALLAFQGCFMYGVSYICVYHAERHIVSGLVAVGYSASPLVTGLGAHWLFGLRVGWRFLLGGTLGLTGVTLMFWHQFGATSGSPDAALGAAFVVAAVLLSAVGSLAASRNRIHGLPFWPAMGFGMLYGAAVCTIVAALQGLDFVPPPVVSWWLSLLYLALAGSVMTFACFLTLQERIGPGPTGTIGVMTPLLALLISMIFEAFRPDALVAAGAVLAVAGNVLMLRRA